MSIERADTRVLRDTGRIAGALAVVTVLIAVIVQLASAQQARAVLSFPFPAQHPSFTRAGVIFAHNLRALAAIAGLTLIARAPMAAGVAPGAKQQLLRRAAEIILGAAVTGNLVVIGAALGAYGNRMLLASLPQAPLELAAYALALAGYLAQRRGTATAPSLLRVAAASVTLLAVAAALEACITL